MGVCGGCGAVLSCMECKGEMLLDVSFTLQGKQGREWRNVSTAVNIPWHQVLAEREQYEEFKNEKPQEMLWSDFRIIRNETVILPRS